MHQDGREGVAQSLVVLRDFSKVAEPFYYGRLTEINLRAQPPRVSLRVASRVVVSGEVVVVVVAGASTVAPHDRRRQLD